MVVLLQTCNRRQERILQYFCIALSDNYLLVLKNNFWYSFEWLLKTDFTVNQGRRFQVLEIVA